MKEIFFRKGKYIFNTIGITICCLAYIWLVSKWHFEEQSLLLTLTIGLVYFGGLLILYAWVMYLRMYVKCILCHQPALVLTDDELQIYRFERGNYLSVRWQSIEAFVPFVYKGNTTYNIVLKDYDEYYQQESNWFQRFLLRINSCILGKHTIANIDVYSMDIDADELLGLLNRHLSH